MFVLFRDKLQKGRKAYPGVSQRPVKFRSVQKKSYWLIRYLGYQAGIFTGEPAQWLIEAAAEIGLDYSELSHEITNHFKSHVVKRHGLGALSITEQDFEKIPGIVRSPDLAIIGVIRENALINVYVKMEPGTTYLYYDETLNSNRNKALRARTFFKIVKPLDMNNLERIIIMNGKTDLSRAKKIIAAGGHPGGEA